jgi:hypothetical protein
MVSAGACINFIAARTNRRSNSMTTDEDAFSCTTRFFLIFQQPRWAIFLSARAQMLGRKFFVEARHASAFASFSVT